MRPIVAVSPSIKGMPFSSYLQSFNPRQDGGIFHYESLDVEGFIQATRDWTETNHDNLPNLFLPEGADIERMKLRVRLPHTNYSRCPRDENHKAGERKQDSFGRVICVHHKEIVIPLGKEGFNYTLEWDSLSAKVKPKFCFAETPSEFAQGYHEYVSSLKDKNPILVVQSCDAIISDVNSLLSLEYIVRKENESKNDILVSYGRPPKNGFSIRSPPDPSKEIPGVFLGKKATSRREMLSFPYDPVHTAYLVNLWWNQGIPGSAPLLREVNAHGPLEDYR